MPQKLNQYLKELEEFRDRALSTHHAMKIIRMYFNHLWIWKKKWLRK